MRSIRLYHVCLEDRGEQTVFVPDVPERRSDNEDKWTPRVCACLTVPDCLRAMELAFDSGVALDNAELHVSVYQARVPVEHVVQPSTEQVPDAWMTGELWVMIPIQWTLAFQGTFRRHMDFACKSFETGDNAVFSRYAFTALGEEEVCDRCQGCATYGEENAFSFLEFNPFLFNTWESLGYDTPTEP